jgi:hypothetical protein
MGCVTFDCSSGWCVGLLIDQPTDGNLTSRQLLSSRRVVCAAPEYIAEHGFPEKP